jgi:prepilin-type N-terminal cleavage/methylation domain-containing protein/prepilin-type processing-associated H-X9-DG protein
MNAITIYICAIAAPSPDGLWRYISRRHDLTFAVQQVYKNAYQLTPSDRLRACATGFTIVELLCVITVVSILAALLMPALRNAKEGANSIVCMNNLRQLYIASMAYANDNGGRVPPFRDSTSPSLTFQVRLMPYLGYSGTAWEYQSATKSHGINDIRNAYTYKKSTNTSTKSTCVWYCPSTRGSSYDAYMDGTQRTSGCYFGGCFFDYGENWDLVGEIGPSGDYYNLWTWRPSIMVGQMLKTNPSKLVYMGDATAYQGSMAVPSNRHYARGLDDSMGKSNVLLWDGHAESAHLCSRSEYVGGQGSGVYSAFKNESEQPGWRYYYFGN